MLRAQHVPHHRAAGWCPGLPQEAGQPAGALRHLSPGVTHLFAEDLAPTAGTVRTARRWLAAWRELPFPRVEQVPRTGPDGQPIGGVQWAVRADDYDDLIHGRLRAAA